jgi:hypothetical protein
VGARTRAVPTVKLVQSVGFRPLQALDFVQIPHGAQFAPKSLYQ